MVRKVGVAGGALALTIGLLVSGSPARAQGGAQVGTLTCNVASGWGFVFGSSRALRCTFASGAGRAEHYAGSIQRFGVDIGFTQAGVLIWAVLAPTSNLAPGALAGNFVGATGSATVGVGAGANVLVGGSNRTISLQPLSFEGSTGLNVAAGIGAINLRYQPQTAHRPRA
jgi:Protein of unknown function (DUF992)